MRKLIGFSVACLSILALNGCGGAGDLGGSSLVKDVVVPGSISARDSAISLLNHDTSITAICDVYSVPSTSGTWGDPLTGTPIVAGGEVAWGSDACDQNWDLKVVDCIGNESIVYAYYRECDTTTYFTFRSW